MSQDWYAGILLKDGGIGVARIGIGAGGVADDEEAGVGVGGFERVEFILVGRVSETGAQRSRCWFMYRR